MVQKDGILLWKYFAGFSTFQVRLQLFLDDQSLKPAHLDMSTRSGLKKVHGNFNAIYNKMVKLYDQDQSDWKVKGGIMGIISRMCVDALLRNKLFEKGASLVAPRCSSFV